MVCSCVLRRARQEVSKFGRTQEAMQSCLVKVSQETRGGKWTLACSSSLQASHPEGSRAVLRTLRSAMVQTFVWPMWIHSRSPGVHGRAIAPYLYSVSLMYLSVLTPGPHCIKYCGSVRNLEVRK